MDGMASRAALMGGSPVPELCRRRHKADPLPASSGRHGNRRSYTSLGTSSLQSLQARTAVKGYIGKTRSRIARDPELAAFIVALAGSKLLKEITAECVAKFGRDRAPSRSAIHRFLVAIGAR